MVAQEGYVLPATDEIMKCYQDKRPVLSVYPVKIDAELLAQTVKLISTHLGDTLGSDEQKQAELDQFDWANFIKRTDFEQAGKSPQAYLETFYQQYDSYNPPTFADAHFIIAIVRLALKAFLEDPAAEIMQVIRASCNELETSTICPICGSAPSLSVVADAHAHGAMQGRTAYCMACANIWPVRRIQCLNCENTEQNKLHYYNYEGDGAHRVQICDKCNDYSRVLYLVEHDVPLSLEVEDVVMADLDFLAQKILSQEK